VKDKTAFKVVLVVSVKKAKKRISSMSEVGGDILTERKNCALRIEDSARVEFSIW
jgi:hypothetical protein